MRIYRHQRLYRCKLHTLLFTLPDIGHDTFLLLLVPYIYDIAIYFFAVSTIKTETKQTEK